MPSNQIKSQVNSSTTWDLENLPKTQSRINQAIKKEYLIIHTIKYVHIDTCLHNRLGKKTIGILKIICTYYR